MKIKTSDTFFPTKFRPTTANTNPDRHLIDNANSRSYKLVKKRSSTQQSSVNTLNQYQSANIFKSTQIGDSEFNYERDRPVGGLDMFLKEHNKKAKTSSTRKLSNRISSPDQKKKQPDQEPKPSKFQQKYEKEQQEQPGTSKLTFKEQIFKSHHSYKPVTAFKNTNHNMETKKTTAFNPKDPRSVNHNNWVVRQTENFENKMSVLNQIYYKKPLIEKYGDRYFEFFLRNRYEEDFAPPIYIHQIKSDAQANMANNDKFISKLKKIHPNIKKFQKLVVKGRPFTNTSQPSQDFNM